MAHRMQESGRCILEYHDERGSRVVGRTLLWSHLVMEEAGERQRVSGGLEISRCMYRVVGANYKRVSFRAIDKKSQATCRARGDRVENLLHSLTSSSLVRSRTSTARRIDFKEAYGRRFTGRRKGFRRLTLERRAFQPQPTP